MDLAAALPGFVRQRALADGATAWLAGLNTRVADLAEDWKISLGGVLHGGTESLVVDATAADGSRCVVKVGLPAADLAAEAAVYRLADGRGYAKLLAHDLARNALLLEHLGPSLAHAGFPVPRQIDVIADTLCASWLALPEDHGFITGEWKARWLAEFIETMWHRLGKPCDAATRNRAMEFAEERRAAYDSQTSVLVHGDAHGSNALTLGPDDSARCKFIDPDGLHAEPACDLAVPMREWSEELLAAPNRLGRARCAGLAARTGVDERAIWQWGFMERVSTGLELARIGVHEESRAMLAVADEWRREAAPK